MQNNSVQEQYTYEPNEASDPELRFNGPIWGNKGDSRQIIGLISDDTIRELFKPVDIKQQQINDNPNMHERVVSWSEQQNRSVYNPRDNLKIHGAERLLISR